MTVGVAAVAGRDRDDRRADVGVPTEAIVLVADRRLTYSADNSVTETWVPKMRGMIGSGRNRRTTWSALYAGDDSLIDDIKAELVSDSTNAPLHADRRPNLDAVAKAVSRAVATVWARGFDEYVFQPFGLTRDDVMRRPKDLAELPPTILEKVVSNGLWFDSSEDNTYGCELALCGFDERERSAVLDVNPKGRVTRHFDTGFTAIGEGCDTATARLELLRYKPWMDLGRVLYMALDAKLTAERVASVGPTTDAWVLLPHREQPVEVPQEVIKMLAHIREYDHRSASFQFALPEDPPLERPPQEWDKLLLAFVVSCYEGSPKALSSIEREPPVWLSKSFWLRSTLQREPSRPSVHRVARAPRRRGSSQK